MSKPLNDRISRSALDDYRITSDIEIFDLLRQVETSRTLVTLSSPEGHSYTTMIWNIEPQRDLLGFSGESQHAGLRSLLESEEVAAVAYLDSIKLQFDLEGLVLVRGDQHDVITARYPHALYRFQRRTCFRVKPSISAMPMAHFPHPAQPQTQLSLRVLDVSLGGVALFLPENIPAIADGTRIPSCSLRLDDDTWLEVAFIMRHATAIHPETRGARLGCEFVNLGQAERDLQLYINQTQKRQLALAARKV
jgi:c-di-GMP-binding flagellar brake protein YcgR